MKAQFSFIGDDNVNLNYSVSNTITQLKAKIFSEELLDDYDKIFVLSTDKIKLLKAR